MNNETFEMVAKTLYGLEDLLVQELTDLGATDLETGRRMVSFKGDKELMYKANFRCRTALRILKPIYHFKASDADEVYQETKKVEWEKFLSLDKTFAIDSVVFSEDFKHSKFVAYRTKDAIADYFMEKHGQRPSVRVNHPDLYINIHISHNDCTLSIDSSGESLHKRGYRVDQTEAPLNEVLAAGMILRSGWRGESNFVDPMCGSGTLLIEAAMIACNIAPGIYRKSFAFEKWMDFDKELFESIYNDESYDKEFDFKCFGSDINPGAIEIAQNNIKSAGVGKYVNLKVQPFQRCVEDDAPKPGILITNPPYGERLRMNDLLGLYHMIGERLKHVYPGYKAWILTYKEECLDEIGLRASETYTLVNGSLDCTYCGYELFAGKNKEYKMRLASGDRLGDEKAGVYSNNPFSNNEERDRRPRRFDNDRRESFDRRGKHDSPQRRFDQAHGKGNYDEDSYEELESRFQQPISQGWDKDRTMPTTEQGWGRTSRSFTDDQDKKDATHEQD